MAPFLLDAVVVIEFLGFAIGCAFFAFWKRPSDRPRWWLLTLGAVLVLLPFWLLPRVKGDRDGLYALGLVPLAVLLAGPSLVAAISGFALYRNDRRTERG